MSTNPADEVRALLARYPRTSPAQTRAALDAALRPAPAPADEELAAAAAAEVLTRLGFTAQDIEDGLADGGSITVTGLLRDENDKEGW